MRLRKTAVGLALLLGASLAAQAPAAEQLGVDAYLYGFPLVLMDTTMRRMTNVPRPGLAGGAPVNQIGHTRAFPEPASRNVVSPNADTLYSIAWLDLSQGPVVLHVPDTGGRYYLMQALDAWTNTFAAPGKRTTGTGTGDFVFSGPQWKGEAPKGVTVYRSPTNMVWILGRIQTNGKSDYAAVRTLQDQFRVFPLSAWGKSYQAPDGRTDPSVDMRTPPVQQVMAMDAAAFFSRLAALMKENPPAAADVPAVKDFDYRKLDAATLERAVKSAQGVLRVGIGGFGALENGWRVDRGVGTYGTEYRRRAAIAAGGLGANLAVDALYPYTVQDSEGRKLSGDGRYVLHFEKERTPPVNAFWSLTIYDMSHFFVPNPIDRYAIGDRDPLVFNADGSLDIYIQNEAPPGKASNWLPAPKDDFNLILRMYWPKPDAWKVPGVRRVP
jgi:hypothetical protein